MELTAINFLVLLFASLVTQSSLFRRIIVILAFSLAKTSFPVNNAISPSSPLHTHEYSRSLVTFASSFNSFKSLTSHCYTSRVRLY